MIRVLIVEDEPYARKEMRRLLNQCIQEVEVVDELDSVEAVVDFCRKDLPIDLAFLDIQLADGLSFEIFEKCQFNVPVVFTTAYDQYTLRAFKVLSVDYLLKPIEPELLQSALNKFETAFAPERNLNNEYKEIAQKILEHKLPEFRQRFLGKVGNKIHVLPSEEVAFFYTEDKAVWARNFSGKDLLLDHSLDAIEEEIDPTVFFRISRQMILSLKAIERFERYGAAQWLVVTIPAFKERILVSRQRSPEFLAWMDR